MNTHVTANVVHLSAKERLASFTPGSNRKIVYRLETSASADRLPGVPITDEHLPMNSDQYDYDRIVSPQLFSLNLHVDWRTFNLELWSKCYCRYDQNYLPTLREQHLLMELSCLKQDVVQQRHAYKRNLILDTFHSVG
jgi:hypothetical protein